MPKESSSSVRVFYPRLGRDEVIREVKRGLHELGRRLPLVLVVLFGSYARGNYTVASDVDLLVVYEGRRRQDAFALVKGAFDIPNSQPHVYSEYEYRRLKDTVGSMIRGGVILLEARGASVGGPKGALGTEG